MPPPAIARPLGLILLLAGSTVLAAEVAPAGGARAVGGPVDQAARPWTPRQASPGDQFHPFDPPSDAAQRPRPAEANSNRDGAATAGRDASLGQPPRSEQVVPAAFQVPANGTPSQAAVVPAVKESSPAASGQNAPLPLAPRRGTRSDSGPAPTRISGASSLLTIGSSLAVVLGLFFIAAWLMRRAGPRGAALLSNEVVEVLGRAPLAGRQQIHVLRFGSKLVLICLGPDGAQSLAEITEPDEVTRLAGLCHQAQPNSATAVFRQVFQQFHSEAGAAKFVVPPEQEDLPLTRVGLTPIQGGRLEDGDV